MKNLESKKQEIKTYKANAQKCADKILTLKLAIKGLLGNIPEYVTDKLIEIAGDIASERSSMEFYDRQAKTLEDEINE